MIKRMLGVSPSETILSNRLYHRLIVQPVQFTWLCGFVVAKVSAMSRYLLETYISSDSELLSIATESRLRDEVGVKTCFAIVG